MQPVKTCPSWRKLLAVGNLVRCLLHSKNEDPMSSCWTAWLHHFYFFFLAGTTVPQALAISSISQSRWARLFVETKSPVRDLDPSHFLLVTLCKFCIYYFPWIHLGVHTDILSQKVTFMKAVNSIGFRYWFKLESHSRNFAWKCRIKLD